MSVSGLMNFIFDSLITFSRRKDRFSSLLEGITATIIGKVKDCLKAAGIMTCPLSLTKEPLARLAIHPSRATSVISPTIRAQKIFLLESCRDVTCPLGFHKTGLNARNRITEKLIDFVKQHSKEQITIASYGSGRLNQDFIMLSQLPIDTKIQKITYVLIDPIYRDQGNHKYIEAFTYLLEKISKETSIEFEVIAFPSVDEYKVGRENSIDLILDIDTLLLEDDVCSPNTEFQKLLFCLKSHGEFISLNSGGKAFIESYLHGGAEHNFHYPLPIINQLYGIPRLFHFRNEHSIEILQVHECNPLTTLMEVLTSTLQPLAV